MQVSPVHKSGGFSLHASKYLYTYIRVRLFWLRQKWPLSRSPAGLARGDVGVKSRHLVAGGVFVEHTKDRTYVNSFDGVFFSLGVCTWVRLVYRTPCP